jgi:SynChlorMet cassette radical SAM/SPASM protein ScmF
MPQVTPKLPTGVPPLSSYYVYLTEGCNLACKHCWLAPSFQPNGGTGGHLDFELFRLAVEEGIPLGLSQVKLTGGEPLLHPDFVKMVDLLREQGLGLTIETNGLLLTETLARYLKEKSSLRLISVSLDGACPETHDAFRGVKGCFEKACRAIRYLAEVGHRPQVIMSLHEDNVVEIETVVRLAQDLGAGSVKLGIVKPTGRGDDFKNRQKTLDFQHQFELGKWVNAELQKKSQIMVYYQWPMVFFNMKQLVHSAGFTCQVFNILGILPSGQLAMCGIGTQVPDLCYGFLGEDKVSDVWLNHPKLVELREKFPKTLEGICAVCDFRNRCLGNCLAENYYVSGRMTSSNWFCQQADEAGLFPASRKHSPAGN